MYLSRMASNTGNPLGVNHACCAIPLYGPDTCALMLLSSVPHGEPCWSSSRTLGSQVWRSTGRQVQYSYVAQGQPPCWARCPCVVIPLRWSHMCILPRYGFPPLVSPCLPWQNPLPSLLCSYLTPGGLGLPQRLPYVVLPSASPYV